MNPQLHRWRVHSLPLLSLLLILSGAAYKQASAQVSPESDAERYVLEQLRNGKRADLGEKFPDASFSRDYRQLRGAFLKQLFTNRDPQLEFPSGIDITGAVVPDKFELNGAEVPHDIYIVKSTFDKFVDFSESHFAGGVVFIGATFTLGMAFNQGAVDRNLAMLTCNFGGANFAALKIGGSMAFSGCKVSSTFSTSRARIAGNFWVDDSIFETSSADFANMRVEGDFSARRAQFRARSPESSFLPSEVSFAGIRAADFFLNDSLFEGFRVDFTRAQADLMSFDRVRIQPGTEVIHQRMSFKLLSPMNAEKLSWLLTPYEAEFHAVVENTFRANGYPDEGDKIFIDGKRSERRVKCRNFLTHCESHTGFLWSVFQDALAGYGKRLQNLLYWSVMFLAVGVLVFRRESGMRTKDGKDAEQFEGKYNPFWYSLDLFLPIIRLGEADVWTPKDYRRWANLYRKVHIIIGSLFVPIGLAAWTGIIK